MFLSTAADIAIYGGAAGGGKSFALLLEPLRHVSKPGFGAVVFRRDRQQVTNQGGLWDEARTVYAGFQAGVNKVDLTYTFQPSGASVDFAGLQYEDDVSKWQGSQIALLAFDELPHFTEYQFFYMLSRNRSASVVKPYVRGTCNPDADSWVAGFVSWWIDQATGFPIPERAGVLRYMVRNNERTYWFDTKEKAEAFAAAAFPELVEKYGSEMFAKSVTFIPADLFDNPALLKTNPGYLANLLALPLIERERLLKGNWKVRASAGKVYSRDWFEIVDAIGTGGIDVRFWDLAATEKKMQDKSKKDPDYTATVKMRYKNGIWTITDSFQIQAGPAQVEKLVFQVAELDKREAKINGASYKLRWEIEPGSASRRENQRWVTMFRGYDAKGVDTAGVDKLGRTRACSVQSEVGNVKLLRADWNNELLTQLHGFPDLPHDDLVDAVSGAFNETNETGKVITG